MARICIDLEGKKKLFSFSSAPDITDLKKEIGNRFGVESAEIVVTNESKIKCDASNFTEYYKDGALFYITILPLSQSEQRTEKQKPQIVQDVMTSADDDLSKYMIPQEMIKKFWGEHSKQVASFSIAHLQALAREPLTSNDVIDIWKKRGYIILELPDEVVKLHATLLADFQKFITLPLEQKKDCVSPLQNYLGYRHRPHFNKELFQVRKSAIDVYKGEEAKILRESADKYFSEMLNICKLFVKIACGAVGIKDKSKADDLVEDPRMEVQKMNLEPSFVSQSNCSIFHYNLDKRPLQEFVHCPYHTDVGLVTIIPRCMGVSGLHVFDHCDSIWLDFELDAPENCAVVFGGESLARLSNNFILPCYHEVSNMAGERFSAPVQCLANRNSILDYSELDSSIVGPCCAGYESPLPAAIFVENVSSSRISSNFPRMM